MNIGSVQNQVSMKMLDLKWQKKKNDINAKKKEGLTQAEVLMQSYEEQAEDVRNSKNTEAIYTKLKTGGTLTADEINFLKQHDPEALADYEKAQAEKEAYKKALKNCKTKEEVNRLNLNRMGGYMSRAKAIANDPYIPEGKKLELMNKLNNEVCLTKEAHMKFVEDGSYEKLPEEAEIAEERAKEWEAEHDAMLAEQMEAAKENDEKTNDNVDQEMEKVPTDEDALATTDRENNQKYADRLKRTRIHQEATKQDASINVKSDTKQQNIDNQELTFDKISKDIERQIVRLKGAKPKFVAKI